MSDPYRTKQVIVMRKDLNMNRGKEIAQGSHAAMWWLSTRIRNSKRENGVYHLELTEAERIWIEGQFAKITCQVNTVDELQSIVEEAKQASLLTEMIIDSGRTYFKGQPTPTCCAIGPDLAENVDKVTRKLELY